MAVRWHQLVSDIIDGEESLQSGECFVVESLELWLEALDSELLIDGIICSDPFLGGSIFHGDEFNVVAIINIAYHNVLVSSAGSYRELFPSSRCKVGLDRLRRHTRGGFWCPSLCPVLVVSQRDL
jgi:hypothetical protein